MVREKVLAIYLLEGNEETCYECPDKHKKKADYVVHYALTRLSKEEKKDYPGAKRKGIARFLCRHCYRVNWLDNSTRYVQGQANFTSVNIVDYDSESYYLI